MVLFTVQQTQILFQNDEIKIFNNLHKKDTNQKEFRDQLGRAVSWQFLTLYVTSGISLYVIQNHLTFFE